MENSKSQDTITWSLKAHLTLSRIDLMTQKNVNNGCIVPGDFLLMYRYCYCLVFNEQSLLSSFFTYLYGNVEYSLSFAEKAVVLISWVGFDPSVL